ncbi:DUF6868 family protein [Methylophaga sp.]|uniref:DUF6868 family protein n=1 Tax=Methylophaga sp. TaxID=2024840 RepID=UPI0013FE5EF9|nr:hypothetical protein [Methylophaga sp.]MTI63362.1 hypothetical protein [Methylophaga sp.]
MDLTNLIAVFGWMTVINFGLLIITTLMLTVFRNQIIRIHNRVTGLDAATLRPAYLYFLAFYKVLIIVFNLTPYLALKLL